GEVQVAVYAPGILSVHHGADVLDAHLRLMLSFDDCQILGGRVVQGIEIARIAGPSGKREPVRDTQIHLGRNEGTDGYPEIGGRFESGNEPRVCAAISRDMGTAYHLRTHDPGLADHQRVDIVLLTGRAPGEERIARVVEQGREVVRKHVPRVHA